MKVLVTTWAWPSHRFPLLPLAWAMVAAGHDVRIATQPGGLQADAGLLGWEVGTEVDFPALFRHMTSGTAEQALAARAAVTESMLDDLVPRTRSWRPDLVVYSPAAQAGPLLAALLGVPAVRFLLGPDFGYYARAKNPAGATSALSAVRKRYGLGEVDLLGTLTLDPCPAGIQITADYARQPVRYLPCNGNVVAPDWLGEPAKRPRICVTWGSTVPKVGVASPGLDTVIDALSGLAADVVVGDPTAPAGFAEPDARGVRIAGSVPLQLLLPSCDLLVSQGGAGTVLTALAAGVPQLLIPQIADQGFNARQVARAGAGLVLSPESCRPDHITRAVTELLAAESYRRAAGRLRDQMAAHPSPAGVVGVLEELVEQGAKAWRGRADEC